MSSREKHPLVESVVRRRSLLFACFGGIVFALSAPPTNWYPAVLVGLALLALSLLDAPTASSAFARGALWATTAGIVGLRFVPSVIQRFTTLGTVAAFAALILLSAGQSLVWAIGSAVQHAVRRYARAPLPLAFGAGTMVAVSLPTIFSWTPGALWSPWPEFVQLADVVGERGVSVLFAVCAALVASSVYRGPSGEPGAPRARRIACAAVGCALLLSMGIYGVFAMRSVASDGERLPTVRVGLVNQAVGPEERWQAKTHADILRRLRDLTRTSESMGAELTIWPEAAYPYPLHHDLDKPPRGARAIVGRDVKGPVLAGLITQDDATTVAPGIVERNSYNSATIVMPDGSMQPPYDKLQLLWFGEMVPGGQYWPWLRRLFQKSGGLIPGAHARTLSLPASSDRPELRLAVLNCYEDTLPNVGRTVMKPPDGPTTHPPNLLVNVTNDAWFFGTVEAELHARLGAMRAIELRRDLVRAVNMGVTSWIDASGRVRETRPNSGPEVVVVTPTIRDGELTAYARMGDWPMWAALVALSVYWALRSRSFARTGSFVAAERVEEASAPPATRR